jgi:hypothetical protein
MGFTGLRTALLRDTSIKNLPFASKSTATIFISSCLVRESATKEFNDIPLLAVYPFFPITRVGDMQEINK